MILCMFDLQPSVQLESLWKVCYTPGTPSNFFLSISTRWCYAPCPPVVLKASGQLQSYMDSEGLDIEAGPFFNMSEGMQGSWTIGGPCGKIGRFRYTVITNLKFQEPKIAVCERRHIFKKHHFLGIYVKFLGFHCLNGFFFLPFSVDRTVASSPWTDILQHLDWMWLELSVLSKAHGVYTGRASVIFQWSTWNQTIQMYGICVFLKDFSKIMHGVWVGVI